MKVENKPETKGQKPEARSQKPAASCQKPIETRNQKPKANNKLACYFCSGSCIFSTDWLLSIKTRCLYRISILTNPFGCFFRLKDMRKINTLILLLFAVISGLNGQNTFTVSGYVTEAQTGESILGANIRIADQPGMGTITNTYGFYSLRLPEGDFELVFSYIGMEDKRVSIEVSENKSLNVEMSQGVLFDEIVVTAEEEDRNVSRTTMGVLELNMEQISTLPVILGEQDILKTIQLLPGVLSAGEGFAGFHVRGGGADQNLVLLDEAIVYNSGHLFGFISVFNSDAIRNTTLIKGGMPPQYGGRISSVLDIQMKDGNNRQFQAEGGIGLISSRLTLQGPIVKEQSSWLVSGRRTYLFDLAQPALEGGNFEGTNYYFYDFNAKVNHRFSDRDRIFFSAYFGRDIFDFVTENRGFRFTMPYGNATATLRWNRTFGGNMFMNTSLIYNDYNFDFRGNQEDFQFRLSSGIRDWNLKSDLDYFLDSDNHLKVGYSLSHHKLSPNQASGASGETIFDSPQGPEYALQGGVYFQNDFKLSPVINILAGLRYSFFSHLGPYPGEEGEDDFERGESSVWYDQFEPRISLNWRLSPTSSIKAGYARTAQYLHLVSSSTSTLPTDIWVPSSLRVPPQTGNQYSIGYFRNLMNNTYEVSVEAYYRDLSNQLDYRETFTPSLSARLENEFVSGSGAAYGLEFFINKKKGDLTGWIAYTLSWADRQFDEINNGKTFSAPYDRRHDLAIVATYSLNDRIDLGASFVFGSGQNYTPIEGLYLVNGFPAEIYGERNSARLPAYHRLDLSLVLNPRPSVKERRFNSYWTFGVYNVYSRKNPLFIFPSFEENSSTGTITSEAFQVSLFPIIPSVSWNFKFK